jgi:hypothetical protein
MGHDGHSSGYAPTKDNLIAAIHGLCVEMTAPESAKKRQNIISHVSIAMLECIASGGGESSCETTCKREIIFFKRHHR